MLTENFVCYIIAYCDIKFKVVISLNKNIVLSCPVCKNELKKSGNSYRCENKHCFDIAKEGYVNLLSGSHKQGELIGDSKEMALSRRAFLEKGYFSSLAEAVSLLLKEQSFDKRPTVLDVCCGEGYYSQYVKTKNDCELFGFDLSKSMVRLAAKRKLDALFFVANLSHIPVFDRSIDFAFHLFAPFHKEEFSRILSDDGVLVTAVPGERHLWQLKKTVYDVPYRNEVKLPSSAELKLCDTVSVKNTISLASSSDIMSLFKMTPYYHHTPKSGIEMLEKIDSLETEIDFVLGIYKKI